MELSLFSVNQNSRKSWHRFSFPFFSFLVRNCFASKDWKRWKWPENIGLIRTRNAKEQIANQVRKKDDQEWQTLKQIKHLTKLKKISWSSKRDPLPCFNKIQSLKPYSTKIWKCTAWFFYLYIKHLFSIINRTFCVHLILRKKGEKHNIFFNITSSTFLSFCSLETKQPGLNLVCNKQQKQEILVKR